MSGLPIDVPVASDVACSNAWSVGVPVPGAPTTVCVMRGVS